MLNAAAGSVALLAAIVLAGVSCFCLFPARKRTTWWVALVATELSPALAVVSFTLAGLMLATSHGASALLALFASLAYSRPIFSAWRTSGRLPADLAHAFGPAPSKRWSWARLFIPPGRAPLVSAQTYSINELALDFYPAQGDRLPAGAPCLVMLHGGGWDSGDRTQFDPMHRWLASRGIAVATPSYRLAPNHPWPAQRDDTLAALAWLRDHAADLGVDPSRLILAGRSAGGQIAAAVAYGSRPPGVIAVAALYACHDLNYVWSIRSDRDALNSDRLLRQFLGGGPSGREALYHSASGEQLAHPAAPPTLLIHGELDELVWCRHSERLAATLAAAGVPHHFLRLPWATHAADAHLHGPAGQLVSASLLHLCQATRDRADWRS